MFDEIGNIEQVIWSTDSLARGLALDDYEIIVVDDCSTDGSGELADRLQADFPPLRVLHHDRNRRLGGALRTGFAAARLDHILYMDADFPVAFSDVEKALRGLRGDTVEMVAGYRFGRAEGLYRDLQSWAYNALLRRVFGLRVRDANFAFKLFRREILETPLCSQGSFIDAELLLEAQRRGWAIREIGFHYQTRQAGQSTMGGPSVIPQLLRDLTRYRRERWHRPALPARSVIFNADDFGLCAGMNAGVIASHQDGVVRSASLIVTGDAFEEAADYAVENRSLDCGLHLALCEGRPACDPAWVPSLVGADGRFHRNYAAFLRRYFCGKIRLAEVEAEFAAQLRKAQARGIAVSHLDSHQHLHALPAVFAIVARLAQAHGIRAVRNPLERASLFDRRISRSAARLGVGGAFHLASRRLAGASPRTPDHFLGVMQAGRWNAGNLAAAIRTLRPGLTEICCHPRRETGVESAYRWGYRFREELEALTGEGVRRSLDENQVSVTSFREYFSSPGGRESSS